MPAFVEEYFSGENSGKFDGLLQQYTSQLEISELHLRGFALALGSLPQKLLQGKKLIFFMKSFRIEMYCKSQRLVFEVSNRTAIR